MLVTTGYLPTFNYIMKSRWLSRYIAPSAKDKHGYGYLIGVTIDPSYHTACYPSKLTTEGKKKIAERLADDILLNGHSPGKKTMSNDLSQCRNDDGTSLSRKSLVGEMLIFMTGGSDPAAYTITMVLNKILRHETVRVKLLTELKEAGTLESSAAGVVTYAQTTRLEYLHAVIQETLRLSPAIQGTIQRTSPSSHGLEVLPGVCIPPGVSVSINSYITQRDRAVFGSDADEFIPERWLPIGGERYRLMARHMFVFGYGSAKCLGQNIAMLKINKCIAEVRPSGSFNIYTCVSALG